MLLTISQYPMIISLSRGIFSFPGTIINIALLRYIYNRFQFTSLTTETSNDLRMLHNQINKAYTSSE